ncbi:MAG: hypothetical protein ISP73_06925 [Flavobacteriales bacterium]|nr:hypothetical protein [Flavobacteriales bacterium]
MKLFYSFLIVILCGCEIINTDESIPAIIEIDTFSLDGDHTQNITDAWIYIDDEFQGVYPLPASFPTLKTGNQTILIEAGIKKNGISSSRVSYPYFSTYSIDTELKPNETVTINPNVNYSVSSFPYVEDFEGVGTILEVVTDSLNHALEPIYDNSNPAFGNKHIKSVISGDQNEIFECTTADIILPTNKQVYLELDYKCNSTLVIGIYANMTSQVNKSAVIYLNVKEDWNKTYLSLSEVISNYSNAQSFKLFFGMPRDTSLIQNEMYLDNIRIVYEE